MKYGALVVDNRENIFDVSKPTVLLFKFEEIAGDSLEEAICSIIGDFGETDEGRKAAERLPMGEMSWGEILKTIPKSFMALRGLLLVEPKELDILFLDAKDTIPLE